MISQCSISTACPCLKMSLRRQYVEMFSTSLVLNQLFSLIANVFIVRMKQLLYQQSICLWFETRDADLMLLSQINQIVPTSFR